MKRFVLILSIIFSNCVLFANVAAINFKNLPSDALFKDQRNTFIENSKYMSGYTYKWEYPVNKDTVIAETKQFESTLSKAIFNKLMQDCTFE